MKQDREVISFKGVQVKDLDAYHPLDGALYLNTSTAEIRIFSGSKWKKVNNA